ncbi:MAG: arginase [Oligoflexales bacterium]
MMKSQSSGKVHVIGVPSDLGANIRGALMGPASIRMANLQEQISRIGWSSVDHGDLFVPVRETLKACALENFHLDEISNLCQKLFDEVTAVLQQGGVPLVLGGDHSIAMGSIAAVAHHEKKKDKDLGVLWFDAHADFNTHKSSASGNIHGMPVAALLGLGHEKLTSIGAAGAKIHSDYLSLIGIRSIDGAERDLCREHGVKIFTMREIDERGMHSIMEEALQWSGRANGGLHVSFDMDALDPLACPAVSTPETGGLSAREAHLALEMVADSGRLSSMDVVELNPSQRQDGRSAQLAVDLILSALGKSIL